MSRQETKVIYISSKKKWLPDFSEIWLSQGNLLFQLINRNVKLRYKQTLLGILWVFIQPLALSGVLAVIFGKFISISTGKDPYIAFILVSTFIWQFFSRSLGDATTSLVSFSGVISKVYFPRVLIPIASILTALFDFIIVLPIILLILFIINGSIPIQGLWFVPLGIIMSLLLSLGLSLFFSSLNILFRDLQHTIPFLLQLGLYISPVLYPLDIVPTKWQFMYSINPMVGILEVFRFGLLSEASSEHLSVILFSGVLTIVFLLLGMFFFSHIENKMIDRI